MSVNLRNKLISKLLACLLILPQTSISLANNFEKKVKKEWFYFTLSNEFSVEDNNSGTIFATNEIQDPVFIINYAARTKIISYEQEYCKKLSDNFFSQLEKKVPDAENIAAKFLVIKNSKLMSNPNGFATLAFYCDKNGEIYVSFIYKTPSKKNDVIFSKFLRSIVIE